MVALKLKHLATLVPATFAVLIGLAVALGRRNAEGGSLGEPAMRVREWCSSRGIGFGTVKVRIQALVDAAGS